MSKSGTAQYEGEENENALMKKPGMTDLINYFRTISVV
jgi:hypothetical protein